MLILGDCLEKLKDIENNSIDLVFADLPYGQTECKWDKLIDLEKLWIELKRVAKNNTPYFFTCTTKFGHSLISSNKKWFRYDLVWEKTSICGHLNSRKMPRRKHEMIYVFYSIPDDMEDLQTYFKNIHKYIGISKNKIKKQIPMADHCFRFSKANFSLPTLETYNKLIEIYKINKMIEFREYKEVRRNRYDISSHKLKFSKILDRKVSNGIYGDKMRYEVDSKYDPPLPTSLIKFKSERGKHPTQKPVTMMKWILKYYSKKGDTILDPVMGSGSMGVACREMDRKFIGIEKNSKIFDTAFERINSDHKLNKNKIDLPQIKNIK